MLKPEIDSLLPSRDFSRRDFVRTSVGSGSAAARRSQFHVYADAGHAFHADYRASYRPADAEDGWRRWQAWFAAHGVA